MKLSKETNLKKQLVSGAVYTSLAVAVTAVAVGGITAAVGGGKPVAKEEKKAESVRVESAESNRTPVLFPEFTFDTPVSDQPQGVDAQIITESPAPMQTPQASKEQAPEAAEPQKEPAAPEPANAAGEVNAAEKAVSEEPDEPVIEWGYDGFVRPCYGYIAKDFAVDLPVYSATMKDYRTHAGVDIACDEGGAVHAVAAGVIAEVKEDPLYGTVAVIDHADGLQSVYAGLSPDLPVTTAVGKRVVAGEVIAGVGHTALIETAEVSHLHFEMRRDGEPVDPAEYITW